MKKEPEQRIGVTDKEEIKKHGFFQGINFELIAKQAYHAPEIELENEGEYSNDEDHCAYRVFNDTDYQSYEQMDQNFIENFDY